MMISPEYYYKTELEGKPAEEIAREIRSLKNEIGHLKKMIEAPDYKSKPRIRPDADTQLWSARLYLERAIAAYEEAGGTYRPGRTELRAAAFDAAIPSIVKLTFTISGFLSGPDTYTVDLTGEHVRTEADRFTAPTDDEDEPEPPMTKEEFLEEFRKLHMGEWRKHYDLSAYGIAVCDGTQWKLTVEYKNGGKKEYDGDNAYPFSFDDFLELIDCSYDAEELI